MAIPPIGAQLHERGADAAGHGLVIARVGPAQGVQPRGEVDQREADGVAGACGKLLQILELRALVDLAVRVDMVDVAQHGPTLSANPSGPVPRK